MAAANLSLILACAGWLLAAYGALSSLGDPDPGVSPAALEHTVALYFQGGVW